MREGEGGEREKEREREREEEREREGGRGGERDGVCITTKITLLNLQYVCNAHKLLYNVMFNYIHERKTEHVM